MINTFIDHLLSCVPVPNAGVYGLLDLISVTVAKSPSCFSSYFFLNA